MVDVPFEVVTSENSVKGNKKIVVAVAIVVFLVLGVVAGIVLVRQRQDIREKATGVCIPECPGADNVLRNCTPPDSDGSAQESLCNSAGRIETCEGRDYCCPGVGAAWTTDMTACIVATPTPTVSPTPTATPTVTVRSTATPTPTVTGEPTATPTISVATHTPTVSPTPTATPTVTVRSTATPTTLVTLRSTPTVQTTPRAIPETGINWPTLAGGIVGIMVIIASIVIAL